MSANAVLRSVLVVFLLVAAAAAKEKKGPPGVTVDFSPAKTRSYIGSPSLAILPDGGYVASHDFFGPGRPGNRTVVFGSTDRGATWQKLAELDEQWWSTLFVHQGALYLLGTTREYGNIVLRRSTDGGRTWATPSILRDDGGYHCAPTPVLVHQNRLWRAFERRDPPQGWGVNFRAGMLSAPVDADLTRKESWTASNFLPASTAWLSGGFGGWLEGNAVATRDGKLLDILRVDTPGFPEKAAMVQITADGRTASFDPASGFIDFPGGAKKFTIRFDPKSDLYWSLANDVPEQYRSGKPSKLRNTLVLISSPDLTHWTVWRTCIRHSDTAKHGFHYVDWLFDGEDLIVASRTAWDEAHNFHDANYLTFHRIRDFRRPPATAAGGSSARTPPTPPRSPRR